MSGLNESNWFDFDSITYIEIKKTGKQELATCLNLKSKFHFT